MDENGYWPWEAGYTSSNTGYQVTGVTGISASSSAEFWKQITNSNISYDDFYMNFGAYYDEPDPAGISDPAMKASLQAASTQAKALNDTNFAKILDFILDKGDKALGILTKTGVIKNQNLLAAQGFSNYGTNADGSAWYGQSKTAVSDAPTATGNGFNIDFTDPKTLIIIFLLLMAVFYFFFFSKTDSTKNAKR